MDTKTILCIDDEPISLDLYKSILESAGYRALLAESGTAGCELARSKHVDAVLLDYWMRGKKGSETAHELHVQNPELPIIVISGFGPLPGEGLGDISLWLVKPVPPGRLLGELAELFGRKTNR